MQKQTLLSSFPPKKRLLPASVVTGNVVDHASKYGKTSSESMRVNSSFTPTPSKIDSKTWNRGSSSDKKQSSDSKAWKRGGGNDDKSSLKQGKPEKFDSKTEKQDENLSLSGTQKQVLDIVMSRKSVFFTGAAGTGKSYILRILQDVMDRLEKADKIAFTASTGVAACNIRGLTIHSWAGIGRATDSHEMIIAQVRGNRNARTRWKETEILVIDEISMLSGELLDLLSRVGKDVRGDNRPFGGMQVILCGDFFQLPPIGLGGKVHFCFESDTWRQLFQGGGLVVLDTVFRQKDDVTFLNILNEMRTGKVSQVASQVLGNRVRQCNDKAYSTSGDASLKDTIGEVRPTKLFATNRDVDAFNASEMLRLSQLGGEGPDNVQRYKSIDEGVEPYLQQLKQGTKAPEFLELRIGAQVMLLKNLDTARGLVNGARGTVIGFEAGKNRSAYFAVLPVVKFNVVLGSAPVEEVVVGVVDDKWDTKLGERILASRIQLPLMLAWAISIHKSQGMTIPLLEVSFNNIFEYGQGYVALSRATCLAGLTLRSFNAQAIKSHLKVVEFYRQLNGQSNGLIAGPATCSTTLDVLAATFLDELPEAPPAPDDGWIDTKKNISSGLNAAVHNIVVKEAPVINGYGQPPTRPQQSQVKYEDRGAYGQTSLSAKAAGSDNPFDGHRYDEWLEGPASSGAQWNSNTAKVSESRSQLVKSDPLGTHPFSPQPTSSHTQSTQHQQSGGGSNTALGKDVGSQRQPVTLGGFFNSPPAFKGGTFAPSSSSRSTTSQSTTKMASIFGSQTSPAPVTQAGSSSGGYNSSSSNISRLVATQQSSQPIVDMGHTAFAASCNPYAKVAAFNHTLPLQQGMTTSGSTMSSEVISAPATAPVSEVKMGDLSDDLKRRIEENRQMALQKQRESKQRREEELQRTMQEHRL